MQTPKSSDQWKGFGSVVTPVHSLLTEEYKLDKYVHEIKGKHSLGSAKTSVMWNKNKDAKCVFDGTTATSFETTQQVSGSALRVKFGGDGLDVHRDMGTIKVGNSGIHYNPWWAWSNKRAHGMSWWDQVWRHGYIFQWKNFMTASEFVWNANEKANGPGPMVHTNQWSWRCGANEINGTNTNTMTPGKPGAHESTIGYTRHESDWMAFFNLNSVHACKQHTIKTGGRFKGKHEGFDYEVGLLADAVLKKDGNLNVHVGGSFSDAKQWAVFKKFMHSRKDGKSANQFWMMLKHECKDYGIPMVNQISLMTDLNDLKNVRWGWKLVNNF